MWTPILLLSFASFGGLMAIKWKSEVQIKRTMQVCTGSDITLGWNYNLMQGETVHRINWFFTSIATNTPVLFASYYHGSFVDTPSYSSRLTHLTNGKIKLDITTKADTGTYTMEITSRPKGQSVSTIRRSVVVIVTDPSTPTSNVLTVKMDQQAVPDANGKLRVRLTCGPLAWRDQPPEDAVWKTPSGALLKSTGYVNSSFYLLLDNSAETGLYTCSLSVSALRAVCIEVVDPMTALRVVDATTVRLTLLEAQLQEMKDEIQHKCASHVGFHYKLGGWVTLTTGDTIKFNHMYYNSGGWYDSSTGVFTAPQAGSYFFIVTVSAFERNGSVNCEIFVDGESMAWILTKNWVDYNPITAHVVVHLVKGSKVWVRHLKGNGEYSQLSMFSGFLINAD